MAGAVHSPSLGGAAPNKSSSWWSWLSAEGDDEDEKKSLTGEDDVDLDYFRKVNSVSCCLK